MEHVGYGLVMLISMSVPIATLVLVILIFKKINKIEKNIGSQ
ncbi:unnamed protein product [marine sediment metagenome]|uniref:Uncharacterized protein n=1 Tax=marine sediment metagenome TaxID=412755 RepID=X1CXX1_9ZZZZ